MPMYNFDPAEEQDDLLEQELLDHGREGSLTGPNAKVSWKVFGSESSCFLYPHMNHFICLATVLSRMKMLPFRPQMVNVFNDHRSHNKHISFSSIFLYTLMESYEQWFRQCLSLSLTKHKLLSKYERMFIWMYIF